jgi:(2Fe-2S) ferredoxin
MARYLRHVFVCVNRRPDGHPRPCCAARGGEEVRAAFKKAFKARGIGALARSGSASCLDTCERGVSVVVYPEGIWYGGVTVADVDEIVDRHVIGGEVVERLLQEEGAPLHPVAPLPRPGGRGPADAAGS